ncbi:MAG: sugar phosphate isomerase/epimerase [Polaribacter sp.]
MNRREFTKNTALSLLAFKTIPVGAMSTHKTSSLNNNQKVPLGICNHSLRSLKLNADQFLDYAIVQNLDSVLLNTFHPFKSLETNYLVNLQKKAKVNAISIYVGVGSICETSKAFSNKYGDAETLLKEGIRVASKVGSPTVGCNIGSINDRYTDGSIEAKMESVIKVMKKVAPLAQDSGIKFAFENHAGDMRSSELLALIDETGTDICGAVFDPANALWVMEDPMEALKILGSNILCTSIRDVAIWETETGATFQCKAIGEGFMDYKLYAKTISELCPNVPLHVETISNSPITIPYLTPEFWQGFPKLSAKDIVSFLRLVKEGNPETFMKPFTGADKKEFDGMLQKSELLKSFHFLRKHCNAGLKF